jgi:Spy/CpxP family protein refolding chaperone
MASRLTQLLLALSLLLNAFVLAGFIYRSWIAPPTEHQMVGPPPGQGPRGPLEQMAAELKLNDEQRGALREVFEKNQADRRQRIQDIQQIREQTGAELRKDPIDWNKVDTLVDQMTRLRGDAQRENLRAIVNLETHLTPQQRQQLHAILADRFINPPRWMGQRNQGGSERGPSPPARPSQ